jgi:uncharacterized protein
MGLFDRQNPVTAATNSNIGSFTSRVYGWMAIGLGMTATIAFTLFVTGLYALLLPMWWMWSIALFGVAIAINASLPKITTQGAIALFLTYAALEGVLFGTILPVFAASYGGQVIWAAFATASAVFGVATLYGIFTKSDLTSIGKILSLGLMGLVAVSLIYLVLSFFMSLPGLYLLISYIGLIIFVGLSAYDAQTIRRFSAQSQGDSVLAYKLSLVMALKMYLNVIMIFWYLLQIFSSSSNRR